MKTTNIKGKEYVEVNERIKHFRNHKDYKGWSIDSEIFKMEGPYVTIKTTIKDSEGVVKATGLAQEKEGSTFINKTSHVENCETSAVGRALGMLGIGIDTSIATAEEVTNAINNQKDYKQPESESITEGQKKQIESLMTGPGLSEEIKVEAREVYKSGTRTDASKLINEIISISKNAA